MKLIAGLGNPGRRYRGTRHNVGFDVLDVVARRHDVTFTAAPAEAEIVRLREPGDALLVRPLTFMNLSGEAVAALLRYYRVEREDLLVVVDDVNLEVGRLRARRRGSDGGHNGLRSIADHLSSDDFARLRVGVGRGDGRRDLADHVLARFAADEQAEIAAAVGRAADAVEVFITDGIEPVMSRFNRRDDTMVDDTEPTGNREPGAGN